jgi:hypothetical protein
VARAPVDHRHVTHYDYTLDSIRAPRPEVTLVADARQLHALPFRASDSAPKFDGEPMR